MRRYSALLLTTMLFPASSHAATVDYPYFITYNFSVSWQSIQYGISGSGYRNTDILQFDNAGNIVKQASFGYSASAGEPVDLRDPYGAHYVSVQAYPCCFVANGWQTSVTFTVTPDTDHWSVRNSGGGYASPLVNSSLTQVISTPIPAALSLFIAGLGIIGWFTRKRPTDEDYENAIW